METFFPTLMVAYLAGFRQAFSKPAWPYFQAWMWGVLILGGRKCTSRVAAACFFLDRSLASWERFLAEYQWDLETMLRAGVGLLKAQLGERLHTWGSYWLVVDTTILAKVRGKMVGVQPWKESSGNPDRGEYRTGHHWIVAALLSRGPDGWQAWPLVMRLLSGQKAPFLFLVNGAGEARAAHFWDVAEAVILHAALLLGGLPEAGGPALRVVVDAYFSKAPFLNLMILRQIGVVSRLRKDAVGWDEAPLDEAGQPRKRRTRWKLAHLWAAGPLQELEVWVYGQHKRVRCVVRDVWLRGMNQPVRVVVVEGKREPILLVSTDRSLCAQAIIEMYAARFSVELMLRDLVQQVGLGDYQTPSSKGIHRFVHLALTAFNLGHLLLREAQQQDGVQPSPSAKISETEGSWAKVRRWFRQQVLRQAMQDKSASGANLAQAYADLEPLLQLF